MNGQDGSPKARHVELYDTTLRDGTQGKNVSLSLQDKLLIAERARRPGRGLHRGRLPADQPQGRGVLPRGPPARASSTPRSPPSA